MKEIICGNKSLNTRRIRQSFIPVFLSITSYIFPCNQIEYDWSYLKGVGGGGGGMKMLQTEKTIPSLQPSGLTFCNITGGDPPLMNKFNIQ